MNVVIHGLGFTARRVATRLLARGVPVDAIVRRPERFGELESRGVRLHRLEQREIPPDIPRNAVWIHSVSPLDEPENSSLRELISTSKPSRILYISSTGVYGAQHDVSANTPVAPDNDKQRARVAEESWLADHSPGSCLILRSAAIYGPGRGLHMRLREGKLPRGPGGLVSRIHVDDLAAILDAAVGSPLAGAWPVADDQPAASADVAAWCARMMGITLPLVPAGQFSVAGRAVDGKEIGKLLGVNLKYPSYCEGYAAVFQEEQRSQRENNSDQ